MRLLHTSDWHIGMAYNKVDRTADLTHAFGQIRALAIEERVDLILNTGDLFDTGIPALEALQFGWRELEELSKIAPVVVLCGNHDAAKLFELMGMLVGNRCNVHFVGLNNLLDQREGSILRIPTLDGSEIIKIASVPFIKEASYIERILEGGGTDRATLTYADEVGRIEDLVGSWLKADYDPKRDVRVFAAHLLLDEARVSQHDVRPMYIERDFVTHPQRIPVADYVAFGHIHKPQEIAHVPHGRYAGSPIQVNFGERNDTKLVYIVSGKPGRPLDSITPIELDQKRRLMQIEDTLDAISANREQYSGTIAKVIVRVEEPVPDLEERVRDMLTPATLVTSVIAQYPVGANPDIAEPTDGDQVEPSIEALFETYLTDQPQLGDRQRITRYFNELKEQTERQDGGERHLAELDEALGR